QRYIAGAAITNRKDVADALYLLQNGTGTALSAHKFLGGHSDISQALPLQIVKTSLMHYIFYRMVRALHCQR
ncbi:hypothetical protein EDM27_17345, partial [Staphylococcus aureus]